MPTTAERVYDLLRRIQQTPGLDPLKRLFWTELNYDRIIYCRLTEDRLLITPQRPVITRPNLAVW